MNLMTKSKNQLCNKRSQRYKRLWNNQSLKFQSQRRCRKWNSNLLCMLSPLVKYLQCHQCLPRSNTHARLGWVIIHRLSYRHTRRYVWQSNYQMLACLSLRSHQRHLVCLQSTMEIQEISCLQTQCNLVDQSLRILSNKFCRPGILLLPIGNNKCKMPVYQWRTVANHSIVREVDQVCANRKTQ